MLLVGVKVGLALGVPVAPDDCVGVGDEVPVGVTLLVGV